MTREDFITTVTSLGFTISNTVSNSKLRLETNTMELVNENLGITRKIRFGIYDDSYNSFYKCMMYYSTCEVVDIFDDQEVVVTNYSFGLGGSWTKTIIGNFEHYNGFYEYPVVNSLEKVIVDLLMRFYLPGKKIAVKCEANDSLNIFNIPCRPYAYEYTARQIYKSMQDIYRSAIRGAHIKDGHFEFVFEDEVQEIWDNNTRSYYKAKAEFCKKYGAD